jgi:hypothetical protein
MAPLNRFRGGARPPDRELITTRSPYSPAWTYARLPEGAASGDLWGLGIFLGRHLAPDVDRQREPALMTRHTYLIPEEEKDQQKYDGGP